MNWVSEIKMLVNVCRDRCNKQCVSLVNGSWVRDMNCLDECFRECVSAGVTSEYDLWRIMNYESLEVIRLPPWDHVVTISVAEEYYSLRMREKEGFGFFVFAVDNELIQDEGWGE